MKNILYLFLALTSFEISAQTTAEEYISSGASKFYLDDMKGAIVDYTKAIKIDSNFVEESCCNQSWWCNRSRS